MMAKFGNNRHVIIIELVFPKEMQKDKNRLY